MCIRDRYNDALKDQIDKLMHTSNLYYNLPIMEAAEKILKVSKMDRVFFTNSGTEAIEGAIKAAKKYAYTLSLIHIWNYQLNSRVRYRLERQIPATYRGVL